MFGLTFEKLFVVAVLAAVLIGPSRLPEHARRLADLVRAARRLADQARSAAQDDMGLPVDGAAWSTLDLREYDPRRIVRQAWDEPTVTPSTALRAATLEAEVLEQAARVRPGQRHLVTGSAAHPRRIRLDSLPDDDPRRRAAAREEIAG